MRLGVLLVSTLIVFTLLSGCGKKSEPAPTAGTTGTMTTGATSATGPTGTTETTTSEPPKPDAEISRQTFSFAASGNTAAKTFSVAADVMSLSITAYFNYTAAPGALTGPNGQGMAKVNFTAPGGGPEALKLECASGTSVGTSAGKICDPKTGSISMPMVGDWTMAVAGTGQNAQVEVVVVAKYTM